MKVVIVAKTRQGSRACVGGISLEGQSVRLVAADAEANDRAGMMYNVGEVWDIDTSPCQTTPPHVENVIVRFGRKVGVMSDLATFVERHMSPRTGDIHALYDGLVQSTSHGALYIAERSGIPSFSTMFWRPDQPMERVDDGKRIRYLYPGSDGGRTLVFVGFQEPVEIIPAGTLVRVSLAHWWRPPASRTDELRCYVQLSGWFLDASGPSAVGLKLQRAPHDVQSGRVWAAAEPLAAADPAGLHDSGAAEEAVPQKQASLAEAEHLLKSIFGYDSFRPYQVDIVRNLLDRKDTLAVMPTGSGKSICYQLPALLFDGLTVVVSPLISLMQDQVDQLRLLGVPAAFLNSTLDYSDYVATKLRARRGEIKLLYTSPETLLRPETQVLLDNARVECFVIDEAHCISSWGHDFRPEYRQLLPVRERYRKAVCAAFTATATPRVRSDIATMLGLAGDNQFVAGFNRENLYLEAQPRSNGLSQILSFLAAHRGESGIIYCGTRRATETIAANLRQKGWPALPYHAGLDDDTRRRHQNLFVRDEASIMVATVAFGMGINKSNVRFVLHHSLPQSIEQYYQEIGRAGRDGLRADCLLLFSRADVHLIGRLIDDAAEAEQAGRRARLQAIVRYAETGRCRRDVLLQYFGEEPSASACGFCDNCLTATEERREVDVTEAARALLSCVKITGQVFGAAYIVDILRGSRDQAILRRHHDRLPVYGTGKDRSATDWRELAEQLISKGLLEQDMEHGGLFLTDGGRRALNGAQVFVAETKPKRVAVTTHGYDQSLFDQLRVLRRQIAEENDVPPYIVFSDRSLVEMVTVLPQSKERFLAVHGVGERKFEQYGERFLELIGAFCARQEIREVVEHSETPERKLSRRSSEVGDMFAAGHSGEEIQAAYQIQRDTLLRHLYHCVVAGSRFPPERILELSTLEPAEQNRVLSMMAQLGTTRVRPVYEALAEAVSFEELQVMRLFYLCRLQDKTGGAAPA